MYIYLYTSYIRAMMVYTCIYCHMAHSVAKNTSVFLWYLHIRLVERIPSVKVLYMLISTETLGPELFLSSPSLPSVFLIDTLTLNECEFVRSGCYPAATFFFLNNRLSHYTLVTHFLYCNYYLISILTYFLIKIFKHVQKLGFDLLYFSYTSGKVLVSSRLFSSPVLPCPLF